MFNKQENKANKTLGIDLKSRIEELKNENDSLKEDLEVTKQMLSQNQNE